MRNTTVTNRKAGFIVLNYTTIEKRAVIGPNGPVLEHGKPVLQDVSVNNTFDFAPGNNILPTEMWEKIRGCVTDDKWFAYYAKYLFPVCETKDSVAPSMDDVQAMNVPNAAIYIDGITDMAELDAVEVAEKAGKDRSGVLNAINETRQAIANAEEALKKKENEA